MTSFCLKATREVSEEKADSSPCRFSLKDRKAFFLRKKKKSYLKTQLVVFIPLHKKLYRKKPGWRHPGFFLSFALPHFAEGAQQQLYFCLTCWMLWGWACCVVSQPCSLIF